MLATGDSWMKYRWQQSVTMRRVFIIISETIMLICWTIATSKQIDLHLDQEINQALQEFNQVFREGLKVEHHN